MKVLTENGISMEMYMRRLLEAPQDCKNCYFMKQRDLSAVDYMRCGKQGDVKSIRRCIIEKDIKKRRINKTRELRVFS